VKELVVREREEQGKRSLRLDQTDFHLHLSRW
jgi:hypothetical protein